MFVVQTKVPSNNQTILRLRLFNLPIVVRFDLDEWSKDILVLVGVIVAQKNRVWFIVQCCPLLQVCDGSSGILLPHLFKLDDHLSAEMTSTHLLLLGRRRDKPRQK